MYDVIPVQMADVLKTRGEDGSSLLTAAAEGGNDTVFVEVLILMGGQVSRRGYMRALRRHPRRRDDILFVLVAASTAVAEAIKLHSTLRSRGY